MKYILAAIVGVFLFSFTPVYAHPGRTEADGGHYCRTNCAKWGKVEGARHFHSKPSPKVSKVGKTTTKSSAKKTAKKTGK